MLLHNPSADVNSSLHPGTTSTINIIPSFLQAHQIQRKGPSSRLVFLPQAPSHFQCPTPMYSLLGTSLDMSTIFILQSNETVTSPPGDRGNTRLLEVFTLGFLQALEQEHKKGGSGAEGSQEEDAKHRAQRLTTGWPHADPFSTVFHQVPYTLGCLGSYRQQFSHLVQASNFADEEAEIQIQLINLSKVTQMLIGKAIRSSVIWLLVTHSLPTLSYSPQIASTAWNTNVMKAKERTACRVYLKRKYVFLSQTSLCEQSVHSA